jgi:hypothetical protein
VAYDKIRNIIDKLTSHRIAISIIIGFMILTFVYLYPREIDNATPLAVGYYTNSISFYQSAIFLVIAFIMGYVSKFKALVDKICDRKLVIIGGYIILLVTIILTFTGHTICIWWTWFSFGLNIAINILAYIFAKKRVSNGEAFIIGVAISAIWRGLWEIPYQMALKAIYDAPQIPTDQLWQMVRYEIGIELPLILGGILILWYYSWKYKNLYHYNYKVIVFGLLYLAATLYWIASGFSVEQIYDWVLKKWTNDSYIDYSAMAIYKFSKVALGLCCAYIIYNKKEEVK